MLKVCLIGIGKTGKEIAKMLFERNDMKIVSAFCSTNSMKKHKDLGRVIGIQDKGLLIEGIERLGEVIKLNKPDIVVDFSNPEATIRNAETITRLKTSMVIGTTGFNKKDIKKLQNMAYSNHVGIVYAPNITLGVNVMMVLSNLAAILLNNYDFQITEIHHKNKKDSPSGTAIKIANEIENGLTYANGLKKSDIPINSVRAGGVVGKHEVMVVGDEDRIIISHESFSRRVFALGAIHAIEFLYNKTGYYEMKDVLCLPKVIEDLYTGKDEHNTEAASL